MGTRRATPFHAAGNTRSGQAAPLDRLADLLAPMAPGEFFARYYEKAPLVLRGRPERARGLISLERVVDAAAEGDGRRGRFHLLRDRLRQGAAGVAPGREAFSAYVEQGLPILWNAAREATPALDRLTHDLAQALGAHVWANVYATGTAGAALDFHFDPHEVLVLHCEGVKEWRVSEVGADRPLDLPAFASAVARELESRRAEARERIEMTFTVEPGDVVYIPRGRFHAARTLAGRSLHVTFGIAPLSGVDFLDVLARAALEDALFRDCLPPRPADPDGRAAVAHLARFRARVLELASSDDLIRRLEALIAERIGRSAPPLETDERRTTRPREERTDSSMIEKRRTSA